MPMPKNKMTAEEYFNTSPVTNKHIELRDGYVVDFASPTILHQRIVRRLGSELSQFIDKKGGKCEPFIAPLDVLLDDENVVQPDVFVVCDPSKLDDKRCYGAPELVIEVVSSNRSDDYVRKLNLYLSAGVKEYWIIDPEKERTLVYLFGDNTSINIYTFDQPIPVGIYNGELTITIADLV